MASNADLNETPRFVGPHLCLCFFFVNILKKIRNVRFFVVLYLSIQLRCCSKNKTKILIKRPTIS